MADGALAVQKAVLAALQSTAAAPIYDAVPQGASYPYITLSESDGSQEDLISHRVERRILTLNVWSRAKGQAEVLGLLTQMNNALHRARFTLDTGRVAGCYVTRKTTNREPDGETYQGQMIVELLVDID